jgi:RNA polymerase sigma-70 factor (ECF subfamily)
VVADIKENPEASVLLADDISFALLLALERLAPLERAAFLLHDALSVPFDEVAHTLGRSETAVRKLASRAREHVRDATRRSQVKREEAERLRDAFLAALNNDDASALQNLLAEDVLFVSDGGGKVPSATVPVSGSERVTQLLIGLKRKGGAALRKVELVSLNGLPGFALYTDSGLETALALEVVDGRIAAMYAVRNPDKLRRISESLS